MKKTSYSLEPLASTMRASNHRYLEFLSGLDEISRLKGQRDFVTIVSTQDEAGPPVIFISRLSSGWIEGFNNEIKVSKRRCFESLNPGNLFRRIWLDLNGYESFAH